MTLLSVPCSHLLAELKGKCRTVHFLKHLLHAVMEGSNLSMLVLGYAGFCYGDEAITYVSSCCWERGLMW